MIASSQTLVTRRMAGFIDHLRLNDFAVGPAETRLALDILDRIGPLERAHAQQGLKSLLSARQAEWDKFDDLFEAYWFRRGRERTAAKPVNAHQRATARHPGIWSSHLPAQAASGLASSSGNDDDRETSGTASGRVVASMAQQLRQTDLRHIADPEELAEAERLARTLATAIRDRLSRRYAFAETGRKLDFRRTFRANLGHGGEPITLAHKARPDRPVRIVVLVDVSGSMALYSRVFLQFVRGLLSAWIDADAYLVHTKLVPVADILREPDSLKAMTRLALMADGFGGGTRLGDCLKVFNDRYAKRALNARSVVMILSDGYDTGTPETLGHELKRLKRRARRLVWLNPMLGWRDYEPVTRAMAAALPLIDHFAAANTLDALAAIEPELARL